MWLRRSAEKIELEQGFAHGTEHAVSIVVALAVIPGVALSSCSPPPRWRL